MLPLSMFLCVPCVSEVSCPYISFPRQQMKFPWCSSSQSNSKRQHQASASSPGYKDARLTLVSHCCLRSLSSSLCTDLHTCCPVSFSCFLFVLVQGFLFSFSLFLTNQASFFFFFAGNVWNGYSWLIGLYFLLLSLISLEHTLVFPLVHFIDDRSRGKLDAWVFRLT